MKVTYTYDDDADEIAVTYEAESPEDASVLKQAALRIVGEAFALPEPTEEET